MERQQQPRVTAATSPPGTWRRQESIQQAVTSYILDNGLQAGDPLPSEHALMAQLRVSRNALREAMKVLDALEIIEIRHGYGTYVGASTLTALEQLLRFRSEVSLKTGLREIQHVLEVREIIEVALARRLATEMPADRLPAVRELVAEMEQRAAGDEFFPELDWRFHESLYQPLDNPLITDLLRVFWQIFVQVGPALPGPQYSPIEAAGWHRTILTALEQRNPVAASEAMSSHFAGIRSRLGARAD